MDFGDIIIVCIDLPFEERKFEEKKLKEEI